MEIQTTSDPMAERTRHRDLRELRGAFHFALFCALFPLAVGVSIFLLWMATRWDWLMLAGGVTLIGGTGCFLAGGVALHLYYLGARRATGPLTRWVWVSIGLCAGLLCSNFLVAASIIWAVEALQRCYTVRIHNDSNVRLTEAELTGAGGRTVIGTIEPHSTVTRSIWIRHDGRVRLGLLSDARQHDTTVYEYVTPGCGGDGHKTATIHADGRITVVDSY